MSAANVYAGCLQGLPHSIYESRLLALAAAVEGSATFSMDRFAWDGWELDEKHRTCGTPACVAGHAAHIFGGFGTGELPLNQFGEAITANNAGGHTGALARFLTGCVDYGSAQRVYTDLFHSDTGCGGAGKSGAKAAAYIREVFIPALRAGRYL